MSDVGFIYAIQSGDLVKIGHSKNPERRLVKINSDTSAPCRLLGYIPGTRAQESDLHLEFASLRAHSEWFRKSGTVAEFLGTLPPPPPKVRKDRKPDKRADGRPATLTRQHPIREYRDAKSISATKLAEDLGVKRNTVWRWENWRRRINPEMWDKIHEVTGIPIEQLAAARKDGAAA